MSVLASRYILDTRSRRTGLRVMCLILESIPYVD